MNPSKVMISLATLAALLILMVGLSQAQAPDPQHSLAPQTSSSSDAFAAMGTAFTYQGQLKKDGQAISGECGMVFRLYDDAGAGSQVGNSITRTVTISNGLFTEALDFGASAFDGSNRWLAIAVKCSGESAFTQLSRQAITAAPYALRALHAASTGALQGYPITDTAPLEGESLVWSNGEWQAQLIAGTVGPQGPQGETGPIGPQGPTGPQGAAGVITAGTGLTLNVGLISLLPSYQLPQACAADQIAQWNGAGWACAAAGFTHDHWGQTWSGSGDGLTLSSSDGQGVVGLSTATSGLANGVYGRSDSTNGAGVSGYNSAASGWAMGVSGTSDSTDGFGVWGHATATSGSAIGVYGWSDSPDGSGVYGTSANSSGVSGQSETGIGVNGYASAITGTTFGVIGRSDSTSGHGVFGEATAISGGTSGVVGWSYSPDGVGVYGKSTATSGWAPGVLGESDSPGGHGGFFSNSSTGVALSANSVSGNPFEAYAGSERKFYVDHLGLAYAAGDVPLLPRAVAPAAATLTTLDSAGVVGYYTSVTIGADGLGLISYSDATNGDLKVAHCSDAACTTATLTTLDSAGYVGSYASVTIGADGLGLISYQRRPEGGALQQCGLHCC